MGVTKEIRCASTTGCKDLAGSIFKAYNDNPEDRIIVKVIGAGALNQATKAVIISNTFFASMGKVVYMLPTFTDLNAGETVTGINLLLSVRSLQD